MATIASNARTQPGPKARAIDEYGPLWKAYWRRRSSDRRNSLVVHHQRLVRRIVARFAQRLPRTVDRGDLETAANVGLIAAIASFDPSRGVPFEPFAEARVRGALLDELRNEDWLPRPWRRRIELQKRTVEELRSELGREPYDHETAEAMGLPYEEYEFLFGLGVPTAPTGSASPGGELEDGLDVLPDRTSAQPGDKLTRTELLHLAAQRMTEQEYRIVYLKYWEELPMREIGLLIGLSESRVCKIHNSLLERLKDRFQAR